MEAEPNEITTQELIERLREQAESAQREVFRKLMEATREVECE